MLAGGESLLAGCVFGECEEASKGVAELCQGAVLVVGQRAFGVSAHWREP